MARLSLVASFFGVASLIVVLSIMNGFNHNQESRLLAVEPHVVVNYPPLGEGSTLDLISLKEQVVSDSSVSEVTSFEMQDVILRTVDGVFSGAEAKGLEPEGLRNLLSRVINRPGRGRGVFFEPDFYDLTQGAVILGSDLARNLNVFEGDEITVMPPETLLMPAGEIPNLEKVRVQFILLTDISEIDSKMLYYVKGETLRRLSTSASRRDGFEIRLKDASYTNTFISKTEKSVIGVGGQIESWMKRNEILFFALKLEKIAMTSFLTLSILITIFSLITVMIMLITDKQKDIGLLMALGLSRSKAQRIFISVGFFLSMVGMMSGLVVGVLISYALDYFPIPMPNIYYDAEFPSAVDIHQVFIVTLALMLLSFIASYMPVSKALNLTPVEALKGYKHRKA